MDKNKRLGYFAWTVYALIVFEILYMISPFAFFYYSAYGLPLQYLQKNKATAWLVQFIMPHFTYSENALISLHNKLGWFLILIGLGLFIAGFCQIYFSKIFRKREVTGGLYNCVRHPQYVSLAILGLGTFLVYPRFIVLITFVTMLFLYYFLARIEEKECLAKFGTPYADYRKKTGMFIPKMNFPGEILFQKLRFLPGKGPARNLSILSLYLFVMAVTILGGKMIRAYSISSIASYSNDSAFAISLVSMKKNEIKEISEAILNNAEVKVKLPAGRKYLLYILPEDWHIPELPVSFKREHEMPESYNADLYKVLVASATGGDETATGPDIFKNAAGFFPHALAYRNVKKNLITKVIDPPASKWEGIAAPLF